MVVLGVEWWRAVNCIYLLVRVGGRNRNLEDWCFQI